MTDQKKLEQLFRQHYCQMYRLATILLHDDAESKDVVHDIFAHLLRESQDLREETADPVIPHIQQSKACIGRLSVK